MTSVSSVIDYQLSVGSLSKHIFNVTMRIPALDKDTLSLTLPAWIPGSYMIRDFARNIISIEAHNEDNEPLRLTKTDKQTWMVNAGSGAVTVTYQVFAFDLSVRSAFINDEYAFCNGTSVFLGVKDHAHLPCQVRIRHRDIPSGWLVETSMPAAKGDDTQHAFICDDYDEVIDHPIFIGQCQRGSFTVRGVEFVLLFSGNTPVDIPRIAKDLTPVCEHHLALFDDASPMNRYVFMTLVSDQGFGGLEHRSSTALLYPRFDLPLPGDDKEKADGYVTFLSLCSHELFHTWHVKRIKPQVLVNPDLRAEVYTEQLWIYEGFTSYYDDLALVRAGTISPERYLQLVGQNLSRIQQTFGRTRQSAAQSSFDAWTRFYKQDASSNNHIISYYLKGGIVAFGLDLLLRRETDNKHNLDDVMRLLWQQYGKKGIGTPDEVIASLCKTHFDTDVTAYLNEVVHGKADVPLDQWLGDMGVSLKWRVRQGTDDKGGKPAKEPLRRNQLGAQIKNAEMGVNVLQIREGMAACQAGIQINDRIIAVGGYVVNDRLIQRLLDTTGDDHLPVTVIREGRLLQFSLPVLAAQKEVCYFSITDESKLISWLGVKSENR